MATAPRPGVTTREQQLAEAQTLITIKILRPLTTAKGRLIPDTHRIGIMNIPLRERLICRKATGLPISAFWAGEDAVDLDSLVVLWWMARRLAGEVTLTVDQAADEWPDDLDVSTELEVTVDGPDSDDEVDDPER